MVWTMSVVIPALIGIGVTGLLVMWFLAAQKNGYEITWTEYVLVMVVMTFIGLFIIAPAGREVAVTDLTTFHEKWNGSLTGYGTITTNCTKDGPCVHEYNCDSYLCHPHDCNCTCTSHDKDGNCTHKSCQTCYDTCWHACPYCDQEFTYVLNSNIGGFTIGDHWLPADPNNHRWRAGVGVPGGIPSGVPTFWQTYKDRIDAGISDPVTAQHDYENFLLANDQTILNQQSGSIESLKMASLLPDFHAQIRDFFVANKVTFVGWKPTDETSWQEAVSRLNGAFGAEMQGDLYVVVVKSVMDPQTYLLALKAYWQNDDVFGRDTLAKNSVLVVVGTDDGQTVSWMRATTGMPIGNEAMTNELGRRYIGLTTPIPLTPEAVIGNIQIALRKDTAGKTEIAVTHSQGYVEDILWGLTTPTTRFQRVSMTKKDGNDLGPGFEDLRNEINPTGGQNLLIMIVIWLVSIIGWLVVAALDVQIPWMQRRSRW